MSRSIALALLLVLAVCAPVRAQRVDDAPPNYQPMLDEAIKEFGLGNYRESLALFRQAQELWPNARALRAIARCQYELADYVGADASLDQALHDTTRPLDGPQRRESEHLRERVREHLAQVTVLTDPPSTQLRLDGAKVERDGMGSIVVGLGVHSLEVSATGFATEQQEFVARADDHLRLSFSLARLAPAESALPVASEPEEGGLLSASDPGPRSDEPLRKKWWLWTGVAGAVVVAVVVTAVLVSRDDPSPKLPSGGTTGIALGVPAASP